MKVVLFCGGLGLRMRDGIDNTPKPMITIGHRPILWHIMKYYAHYGYTDFILALGYQSDVIKRYFLAYDECISNNFILENGGKRKILLHADIQDWRITFVDTGIHTPIGERLLRVRPYLDNDEVFLANYTDSLTDCPLPPLLELFNSDRKPAAFLCVTPPLSFHVVSMTHSGAITSIEGFRRSSLRINGGYFMFRNTVFDYLKPGEELVEEPFRRLITAGGLHGYKYDGFWASMDTFKDKQNLEDIYLSGTAPWVVWRKEEEAEVAKERVTLNV